MLHLLSHMSFTPVHAPHRHIYGETLGAWRTADLLIGLAYLARREPPGGGTLGDVAAAGRPYGMGLEGDAKEAAKVNQHRCHQHRAMSDPAGWGDATPGPQTVLQ